MTTDQIRKLVNRMFGDFAEETGSKFADDIQEFGRLDGRQKIMITTREEDYDLSSNDFYDNEKDKSYRRGVSCYVCGAKCVMSNESWEKYLTMKDSVSVLCLRCFKEVVDAEKFKDIKI